MKVLPARYGILLTVCACLLSCASGVFSIQTADAPEDIVAEFHEDATCLEVADLRYSLTLDMPDWRARFRFQSLVGEKPVRLAHVPLDGFSFQSFYLPTRVRPARTQWAEPWNKEAIVTTMNGILMQNGIEATNARVRMIAHAVVASGWRQNVWNHNVWGVQKGSWQGSWYEMPTFEEDAEGNRYRVPDASWRSFSSWDEAIGDFIDRISPGSDRPSYRQAFEHLRNSSARPSVDAAYWQSLGEANYYTDTAFTPRHYARLCHFIRQVLASETAPETAPETTASRVDLFAAR